MAIPGIKVMAIALFLLMDGSTFASGAQRDSGAVTPQQAADYIREHPEGVIVDVASKRNYAARHFRGAVNIPIEDISHDEAVGLYKALPAGRPVIALPAWHDSARGIQGSEGAASGHSGNLLY